jgi:DHA1 family bicyclomycin/chloramphenicol resistance-like MFS transporter
MPVLKSYKTNPTFPVSAPSISLLILFLAPLLLLSTLSIDLCVPYVPLISYEFHCTFTQTQLALTIPILMKGFSQIFWGRSIDSIGVLQTLTIALCLHFIGSFICWKTEHIYIFLLGRSLQGLGACGAYVFAISLARLQTSEPKTSILLARLTGISGTAPIFAPFLGLAMTHYMGSWKGVFFFLLCYVGFLASCFAYFRNSKVLHPELTSSESQEKSRGLWSDIQCVIKNTDFKRFFIVPCLILLGMVLLYSFSTFYLQQTHKLEDMHFRLILSGHAAVYVLASFFLTPLVMKNTENKMTIGLCALLVLYVILYISSLLYEEIPLVLFLTCIFLMSSVYGTFYGPSIQNTLRSIEKNQGLATAVLGMLQFTIASVVTIFAFTADAVSIGNYVTPLIIICTFSLFMITYHRQSV